jgi:hypothetical protein
VKQSSKKAWWRRVHNAGICDRDRIATQGYAGRHAPLPLELRKEVDYFGDILDEKVPKDMLDLPTHIVETEAGHFAPKKFESHYETCSQS